MAVRWEPPLSSEACWSGVIAGQGGIQWAIPRSRLPHLAPVFLLCFKGLLDALPKSSGQGTSVREHTHIRPFDRGRSYPPPGACPTRKQKAHNCPAGHYLVSQSCFPVLCNRGGTGRRSRLRACRPFVGMGVRLPPVAQCLIDRRVFLW